MENVITQESSKAIEFNYYLPVNIVFGSGKVNKAGELAKPYGKKALIVTGKSSAKKSGLYDKVNDSLKQAGLETELFDKVSQNPLTTTAGEGAAYAKEKGCDVEAAFIGNEESRTPDCMQQMKIAENCGVPVVTTISRKEYTSGCRFRRGPEPGSLGSIRGKY